MKKSEKFSVPIRGPMGWGNRIEKISKPLFATVTNKD